MTPSLGETIPHPCCASFGSVSDPVLSRRRVVPRVFQTRTSSARDCSREPPLPQDQTEEPRV